MRRCGSAPRAREHPPAKCSRWFLSGSAPRSRGTPRPALSVRSGTRVSPACAGNTDVAAFVGAVVPGQPRVRGEHRRGPEGVQRLQRVSPACAGNTSPRSFGFARRSGQPRVRGEHSNIEIEGGTFDGSAPRARGTAPRRRARVHAGNSPACAGNTSKPANVLASIPGQPRVRGEHQSLTMAPIGSAPRARGTQNTWLQNIVRGRVSPACAGNTADGSTTPSIKPGQPRVRGEHQNAQTGAGIYNGSAPRARGTPDHQRRRGVSERVSPACAGNTAKRCTPLDRLSGQPRVRGEHPTSPAFPVPSQRVSPACAGNTLPAWMTVPSEPGQPRVRGEHTIKGIRTFRTDGSAPRARGTPGGASNGREAHRVSPACAGNTAARTRVLSICAGQPRVRGEHSAVRGTSTVTSGSAPRARGTRRQGGRRAGVVRVSPACAGNTGRR